MSNHFIFLFLHFTPKMQTITLRKLKVTDLIITLTFNQFESLLLLLLHIYFGLYFCKIRVRLGLYVT